MTTKWFQVESKAPITMFFRQTLAEDFQFSQVLYECRSGQSSIPSEIKPSEIKRSSSSVNIGHSTHRIFRNIDI